MGNFEKFVQSDAFFPVLLVLVLVLFISLIAIIIVNRKGNKKESINETKETSSNNSQNITENSNTIMSEQEDNLINSNMEFEKNIEENLNNNFDLTNTLMSEDSNLAIDKEESYNPFDNSSLVVEEPIIDEKTSEEDDIELPMLASEKNSEDSVLLTNQIEQVEQVNPEEKNDNIF